MIHYSLLLRQHRTIPALRLKPVSYTHLVEGVFTVLALHDAFLPATVNLQEPDPELDLDYIPNQGRALQVDYAMSDSLGFGGHNACVVFKRWEG